MRRGIKGLLLGMTIGLIGSLFGLSPYGTVFERNVGLDWLFQTRGAIDPPAGVAVIAIDGSYGTLNEIAYALIHKKPIVGIDTWDFAYHGHDGERIVRAKSPTEAVERAIEMANRQREGASE